MKTNKEIILAFEKDIEDLETLKARQISVESIQKIDIVIKSLEEEILRLKPPLEKLAERLKIL